MKLFTLLSLLTITIVSAATIVFIVYTDDCCNKRYDNQDLIEE